MTALADLPEADRKLIAAGRAQPAKSRTAVTAAPTAEGRSHWTCHTCAEPFDQWATAERHLVDVHGGGRMELVLVAQLKLEKGTTNDNVC